MEPTRGNPQINHVNESTEPDNKLRKKISANSLQKIEKEILELIEAVADYQQAIVDHHQVKEKKENKKK